MSNQPPAQDEPEVAIGSREQLLHLLAEASEIEHTLMCSYLYAAFSLKRAGDVGLSQAQGAAVERWRKAIMDVAVEEMGHLLTVANLTVAVGGRPHFARPNFPVSPGYFPAGVVVRLSGFSEETLDHFIFLERPRGVEGEDADSYEQADYARDHARPGLMPTAQDYTTIGHLYEAIRQNLRALAGRLGESGLFIGRKHAQVGAGIIDLDGVATISDLSDALAAIDFVVEQGEGSPSDEAESHYRSFLALREELDALRQADARFVPAWPVAGNPVLRKPPEPEDKVYVSHPQAAKLLDFACATYGLLLRVLGQAFARPGDEVAADQKKLVGTAFDLMHVLGAAASQLARLPAMEMETDMDTHAGMSFTMLRGVEPLLTGSAETQVIREQLMMLAEAGLSPELTDPLKAQAAVFDLASAR
ncbi:ferritin-like protein [Sphingobium sp. AN558]|uniref:ferritin-like domain-containing protein n=1 Tax=Sphingobium sp. AN558 TaxID=3133442 RepID=UPI0030BDB16F